MKLLSRLIFSAVLVVLLMDQAASRSLEGHWQGAVVRDGAVQVMEIELADSGAVLTGRYSIPELCLFDEPLTDVDYNHPSLSFHFLYGTFTTIVHDTLGAITGVNNKWGPPVRIHLKRALPDYRVTRRQISFSNGGVTLRGTLVLPDCPGPYPAIVVVHGSGPQGRQNWAYRSYGDFFARHGIAALVYDKRGVGESGGEYGAADFYELADDVVASVGALSDHPEIDTTRIGLFGISQGGWLAPLAAHRTGLISFLILDVGPAVSVWQQEKDRVEYSLRHDGFSETDIADAIAFTVAVFDAVDNPTDGWNKLEPRLRPAREASWHEYVSIPDSAGDLSGWALERYDPADVLRSTTLPILALFGADDPMVPPDRNVPLLRTYLDAAGNQNATIRIFPSVGHDMETGRSLIGNTWDWPDHFWRWSRKAPGYLETILDWVKLQ